MPPQKFGLLITAMCWVCAVQAETVVIHAGALVDVEAPRVLTEQTIVIEDDRIARVSAGYEAGAKGARIIDLRSATVMPGWIDAHVHIDGELSDQAQLERFTLEPALVALRATVYARRTLDTGFTTVRDLGTDDGIALALRDAIRRGYVSGPRIVTAGKAIATTGGHADPSNGMQSALRPAVGPENGVINGAEDAYKAVRARYQEGSDLIKITATGGVLSVAKSGQNPQFTDAELTAIVTAAKDYGFRVAAHAHGEEGMYRAVAAGVDSIEHGTMMSRRIMDLMIKRGTWYVPTISAGMFVAEKAAAPGYFPEIIRPKALAIGPQIKDTFAAAYKRGVKIAFGTDCGVCPHGSNWQEFVYMHDAGMPMLEAIQTATLNGAQLLDHSDDIGTLTAGKLADIVAVPGDPVADPALMGKVHFVMKGGVVYKSP